VYGARAEPVLPHLVGGRAHGMTPGVKGYKKSPALSKREGRAAVRETLGQLMSARVRAHAGPSLLAEKRTCTDSST
jgi:hypothetical protein